MIYDILHKLMWTHPCMHTQHTQTCTDLGTKLCALCSIGDEAGVRRLLDDSHTDVNETDSTGETPLHKACQAGELQIMTLLLNQNGIDISRRSSSGQTPLHIASKMGNVEAAELLLDAESDERNAIEYVNLVDDQRLTPLCYSSKFSKDNRMADFLQQRYVYYYEMNTYKPVVLYYLIFQGCWSGVLP